MGRSHRIGGARIGLQRHLKRESIQQGVGGVGENVTVSVDGDRDAATVAKNDKRSSDGARFGVTLTDGPARE